MPDVEPHGRTYVVPRAWTAPVRVSKLILNDRALFISNNSERTPIARHHALSKLSQNDFHDD